jgi:hypothetical protein
MSACTIAGDTFSEGCKPAPTLRLNEAAPEYEVALTSRFGIEHRSPHRCLDGARCVVHDTVERVQGVVCARTHNLRRNLDGPRSAKLASSDSRYNDASRR